MSHTATMNGILVAMINIIRVRIISLLPYLNSGKSYA
jgi:hypothetical protein